MLANLLKTSITEAGPHLMLGGKCPTSIQAVVIGVGAVSATVIVEVSNNDEDWESDSDSIIQLSGTARDSGAVVLSAPWRSIRARVSSIAGTSAAVTVVAEIPS